MCIVENFNIFILLYSFYILTHVAVENIIDGICKVVFSF